VSVPVEPLRPPPLSPERRAAFIAALAKVIARRALADLDAQHATALRGGDLPERGAKDGRDDRPHRTP
jgi:hypothetical protein